MFTLKSNSETIVDKLVNEIKSQESFHANFYEDLLKVASSPAVIEEEFHASFLKALSKSGLETKLQNFIFHLLRTKKPEEWIKPTIKQEALDYMIKTQASWERRIQKSLNTMSSELGISLAKIRCQSDQDQFLAKWSQLSTLDMDLSLFIPVYAAKDFLDILGQIKSPNLVETAEMCSEGESHKYGMIKVPIPVPSLKEMQYKFSELSWIEPHLGVNSLMSNLNESANTFEADRYNLGCKVIKMNHAPLSQEYLKKGCPHSLRGKLWSQVLGSEIGDKEIKYFETLKMSVIKNDILVDKLIIKDVQLTAANDDNYFIFEDTILQVILCFLRDTEILDKFQSSCSSPAKATLRGKTNTIENSVIYPPNGIIPFHGFTMYCAPFCYIFDNPIQMYFAFRAFYVQFACKLHEISSDSQGIITLAATFEQLLQTHEPQLWNHLVNMDKTEPLRCVFRWLIRGFSGHLPPEQLLYLWDLVLAYDSVDFFSLLAVAIFSYRKDNLMIVTTLQGVEAVLGDLSSIPVIPLIQLTLELK